MLFPPGSYFQRIPGPEELEGLQQNQSKSACQDVKQSTLMWVSTSITPWQSWGSYCFKVCTLLSTKQVFWLGILPCGVISFS